MKNFRVLTAAAAIIALAGCSSSAASYRPGTYTGTAEGHNGDLSVEVTVSESAITDVKVTYQEETAGIADAALETIPALIVNMNTPDVDAVSGATDTSEAIIEAVKTALSSAK